LWPYCIVICLLVHLGHIWTLHIYNSGALFHTRWPFILFTLYTLFGSTHFTCTHLHTAFTVDFGFATFPLFGLLVAVIFVPLLLRLYTRCPVTLRCTRCGLPAHACVFVTLPVLRFAAHYRTRFYAHTAALHFTFDCYDLGYTFVTYVTFYALDRLYPFVHTRLFCYFICYVCYTRCYLGLHFAAGTLLPGYTPRTILPRRGHYCVTTQLLFTTACHHPGFTRCSIRCRSQFCHCAAFARTVRIPHLLPVTAVYCAIWIPLFTLPFAPGCRAGSRGYYYRMLHTDYGCVRIHAAWVCARYWFCRRTRCVLRVAFAAVCARVVARVAGCTRTLRTVTHPLCAFYAFTHTRLPLRVTRFCGPYRQFLLPFWFYSSYLIIGCRALRTAHLHFTRIFGYFTFGLRFFARCTRFTLPHVSFAGCCTHTFLHTFTLYTFTHGFYICLCAHFTHISRCLYVLYVVTYALCPVYGCLLHLRLLHTRTHTFTLRCLFTVAATGLYMPWMRCINLHKHLNL